MQITNTQPGPRGVNTINGPVLVEPGETVDVEVFEREKEHLEAAAWFTIEGSYTANINQAGSPDLKAAASGASEEIADLKRQLAEKDAEILKLKGDQPAGAYSIKETSPGWFGVFGDDGKQIGKNMRESDAKAFEAMSPEDQKAYLAD
jgi:hypothetical protein